MKRLILWSLLLFFGLGLNAQSRIRTDVVASKVLGREVNVNVCVPRNFDASDKHYPVLYLLHGLYGNHTDWETRGGVRAVLDELTGTGEAAEMIIVMPCAGDQDVQHVQNGYFNMPDCPYEDFFFQELIPTMEQKYRCGGSKTLRAVAGLSMGGGGSVVYAQRHPDMFSSCYGMSAWLDNQTNQIRQPADQSNKLYITAMSVREHSALDFIDKADEATIEALRGVKWFLDCGDDDGLLQLSVDLFMKMRRKGINCELRVRNGAHTWEYWHTALRLSLPFATRNYEL